MFNFGKRLLTAMLSAAVILPALAVPTAVTAAENGADASVTYEEAEDTSGSSEDGHYSTDDVAGDLLVPHTGKSSEVSNPDIAALGSLMTDASVYEENMITLSCDSGLYDALGFSSQGLIRPHTAVRQGRQGQQRRRRARRVGLAARHGIKPLDA